MPRRKAAPAEKRPSPETRPRSWWMIGALALALLAYAPALRAPAIFDDSDAIENNESIRGPGHLTRAVHPPKETPVAGRPVSNLTFAINVAVNDALGLPMVAGDSRWTTGFHLVNVALHLATGLLLFGILRRTSRAGVDAGVATVVAAIWLVHPIQTEAVNYLTQRTELLVSFFYAATLYFSIRAFDEPARAKWTALAAGACLLGMGSKEVMITAPLTVLLYDRAFRSSSWREIFAARDRRVLYSLLGATMLWCVALVATTPRARSAGFSAGIPWYRYLHSQGWAILHYLRLVVWPSDLTLDYGRAPVTDWRATAGLVALAAAGIATVAAWVRARHLAIAFAGAWFFLLLAPSSSVVPIATEIAAERRIYLALAAPLVVIVAVALRLQARARLEKRVATAVATLVILVLGIASFSRSTLYRDPEALWRDALAKVPHNPRSLINLGVLIIERDRSRQPEAESLFAKAESMDSNYVDAVYNMAAADLSHDRIDAAEARLRRVMRLDSTYMSAHAGMGAVYLSRNQPEQAIIELERVSKTTTNAGTLVDLGDAYSLVGKQREALETYRRAVEVDPSSVAAASALGAALTEAGRPDEAIPLLERAIASGGATSLRYAMLAVAYGESGHPEPAIEAATRAVNRSDADAQSLVVAGRALLTARVVAKADSVLTRAVALAPRDQDALLALAVARAQSGDRASAVLLLRRVLSEHPENEAARRALATLGGR